MPRALARLLLAPLFTVGCAASPIPPASPPPSAPAPSAPATIDEPVGAVPLPDPNAMPISIDEIDTTVALADLPRPHAAWTQRAAAPHAGRVLLALATRHDDENTEGLYLFVVDAEVNETGYPGSVESWRVATIDHTTPRISEGNAFSPRYRHDDRGAPLKFAIRFLPREHAPEAERTQLAVYAVGTSVFVAEKLLVAKAWTPRLRIDMPHATQLVAVAPGWH